MKIRILTFAITLIVCILNISAQEVSADSIGRNNWGGKLIKSPFGLGLDVQTKYVWRGMEMMTEDAAPVLFPAINYTYKGLYIYATFRGKFQPLLNATL